MLGKISRRNYGLTHNAMVVISRSVNPPALFLGKLPADNQYSSAKLSAATDNCHLSAVLIEMTRMREAYSNTSFYIWSRILATIFAILLPTDTGAEDRCLLAGQMSFLERDVPGHVRAGGAPELCPTPPCCFGHIDGSPT